MNNINNHYPINFYTTFTTHATDNTDLFTGVLYNNYGPPNGFCFDILCDDEPIIDNKHSPDYNVDRRVSTLFFIVNHLQTTPHLCVCVYICELKFDFLPDVQKK